VLLADFFVGAFSCGVATKDTVVPQEQNLVIYTKVWTHLDQSSIPPSFAM
jgi:hypothetical protein